MITVLLITIAILTLYYFWLKSYQDKQYRKERCRKELSKLVSKSRINYNDITSFRVYHREFINKEDEKVLCDLELEALNKPDCTYMKTRK